MTATLGLALALVACGGGEDGGDSSKPTTRATFAGPTNGLETKSAAEVISAAAAALREVASVHYKAEGTEDGQPTAADLRLAANGTATGVIDGDGQRVEILRLSGIAYVRGPSAATAFPGARVDQWINTGPVGETGGISIDSAAEEVQSMQDYLDSGEEATVEQLVEKGSPVIRVAVESGELVVANAGPALPLRQVTIIGEDRIESQFSEYGAPFQTETPTEVFKPETVATS